MPDNLMSEINRMWVEIERLKHLEVGAQWTFLTTPLTNADWDDDPYSTTAKTVIDLSTVFGVPAGVKAILARVHAHDSGSASGEYYLILSPNNTAGSGVYWDVPRSGNDHDIHLEQIVPCDANGDVYYQINASGAGTMDIQLVIWGYAK